MTAQNQSWAWDVIYDPFGNVSYSWSNPEVMNIRFPGQWFQLETGLAYNWHRHYDATLGRYVQPDPLGLDALMSDGPSAYGYVGGNPLAHTDPSGNQAVGVCVLGGVANPLCDVAIAQMAIEAAASLYGFCSNNTDCSKATPWQIKIILAKAGVIDEHAYKDEYGAVPNSSFDICACKDGSVVIKNVGGCGRPGPAIPTYERWK